ncbi:MAG: hypothetical protein LUH53_10555 [Lachnospiraceae bacterium]|nr:hypothetical protein [Lachnospiraceae bacterium]
MVGKDCFFYAHCQEIKKILKISTRLLTWLTNGVIVRLYERNVTVKIWNGYEETEKTVKTVKTEKTHDPAEDRAGIMS